jgi:pimeloyl-ACP methyl ester carboxylesterase
MPLVFEEYGFDPRPQFPFVVKMKRYPNLDDEQNRFALILLHGNGFPKETWEPIVERIFATENAKPNGLRIREAWAIDAPNHGDTAALNAELLQSGAYDITCESLDVGRHVDHAALISSSGIKSAGKTIPELPIWSSQDWGFLPMTRTSLLRSTLRVGG